MCKFCDFPTESYIGSMDGEYFVNHARIERDNFEYLDYKESHKKEKFYAKYYIVDYTFVDEYNPIKIQIYFCPFCGRELPEICTHIKQGRINHVK